MDDYIKPFWKFKDKNIVKVLFLKLILTFLFFIIYPFAWYIRHFLDSFKDFKDEWKIDFQDYKKIMRQKRK